jgi:hypothetical protein
MWSDDRVETVGGRNYTHIMATIRNGKISTTFKYVKVGCIPELALGAVDREYSDGSYQSTVLGSSVVEQNVEKYAELRSASSLNNLDFILTRPIESMLYERTSR